MVNDTFILRIDLWGSPKSINLWEDFYIFVLALQAPKNHCLPPLPRKLKWKTFPLIFRAASAKREDHLASYAALWWCLLCCRMFHSVKHDNNDIINVLISLWVIAFVSWGEIVCFRRRMLTCIRTLHAMAELFDSSEGLHGWSIILCEQLKSSQKIQYLKRLKTFVNSFSQQYEKSNVQFYNHP